MAAVDIIKYGCLVNFILDNANASLELDKPLTKADIISERCGVRRLAIGAVEAFKAADQTDIPVFGVDALTEAVAMVRNGQMAGTVLNDAGNKIELFAFRT